MMRLVPKVTLSDERLLTLKELSRQKNLPITRTGAGFKLWIERGVQISPQNVVIHLPHTLIGNAYYTTVSSLRAFINATQDYSQESTALLADKRLQPMQVIRGDLYESRGVE